MVNVYVHTVQLMSNLTITGVGVLLSFLRQLASWMQLYERALKNLCDMQCCNDHERLHRMSNCLSRVLEQVIARNNHETLNQK